MYNLYVDTIHIIAVSYPSQTSSLISIVVYYLCAKGEQRSDILIAYHMRVVLTRRNRFLSLLHPPTLEAIIQECNSIPAK
jgi:hypothetical protein